MQDSQPRFPCPPSNRVLDFWGIVALERRGVHAPLGKHSILRLHWPAVHWLAEFQRAFAIDASSSIAEQEIKATTEQIAAWEKAADAASAPPHAESSEPPLAAGPPKLKPLSYAPINYRATIDAKIAFETIGKLAGLTIVFDPAFPARRITVDLNNITLEQALEVVSLQSKAVWKPVTENIVFVFEDSRIGEASCRERV